MINYIDKGDEYSSPLFFILKNIESDIFLIKYNNIFYPGSWVDNANSKFDGMLKKRT